MPLIKVQTSLNDFNKSEELLESLSSKLSNLTGKPEQYVMTILETNSKMTFGGNSDPSCYVEVKSIGALNQSLMSESFCEIISSFTTIPSDRIYIEFEDVKASNWGFNRKTFG